MKPKGWEERIKPLIYPYMDTDDYEMAISAIASELQKQKEKMRKVLLESKFKANGLTWWNQLTEEEVDDIIKKIGGKMKPEDNKFHKGAKDGKHYWLTPPDLYKELDNEFHFDFDPCPYPKPDDFDGLTAEWGSSNYVNPPFGAIMHQGKKKGQTAWTRKAIEEYKKGKRVVMVFPIDKWILMLIKEGVKIRNLGDVRWLSIEDKQPGKGTGRHIACFILEPDIIKKLEKGQ